MKALLSFLIVGFLVTSCYKYEEGPRFSLLSRKARLCNEWVLEAYLDNGTDKTNSGETTNLTIENDGTYSISIVRNEMGQVQSEFSHGTWYFQDSKGQIVMTDSQEGAAPITYDILELRNSNLQLRKKISAIYYIYKYRGK
ncbi:MAG: hypothetical protein FJX84_02385 [Bacteroidetes bacterium]|nr:hypothetical protein [Bacteroidota bacterium]